MKAAEQDWEPCGRGVCSTEAGHAGTCAEASGWADPKRIQQRRTKGWRKPKGAVSVSRGTEWGNPWVVGERYWAPIRGGETSLTITPELAVAMYRQWLIETYGLGIVDQLRRELGGRDLMCWCRLDRPCHADVLLELANSLPSFDPIAFAREHLAKAAR